MFSTQKRQEKKVLVSDLSFLMRKEIRVPTHTLKIRSEMVICKQIENSAAGGSSSTVWISRGVVCGQRRRGRMVGGGGSWWAAEAVLGQSFTCCLLCGLDLRRLLFL